MVRSILSGDEDEDCSVRKNGIDTTGSSRNCASRTNKDGLDSDTRIGRPGKEETRKNDNLMNCPSSGRLEVSNILVRLRAMIASA